MQDFNIFGLEGLFFFCILLRVLRQGISSSICLALIIIDLKVIRKEFLSLVDLSGAQTLHVYELTEVIMVGKYKHLMLAAF